MKVWLPMQVQEPSGHAVKLSRAAGLGHSTQTTSSSCSQGHPLEPSRRSSLESNPFSRQNQPLGPRNIASWVGCSCHISRAPAEEWGSSQGCTSCEIFTPADASVSSDPPKHTGTDIQKGTCAAPHSCGHKTQSMGQQTPAHAVLFKFHCENQTLVHPSRACGFPRSSFCPTERPLELGWSRGHIGN